MEPMSQDEENGASIITLSNVQSSTYIVHHVSQEQIEQLGELQIHPDNQQDHSESGIIEMDEFLQLKQSNTPKSGRGRLRKPSSLNSSKMKSSPKDSPREVKPKNFSDSWLLSSFFKDWLERHPSSNTKAICKVCNKVLLAGKSELMKHGMSKKHKRFLSASMPWDNDKSIDDSDLHDNSDQPKENVDGLNCFEDDWLHDPLFKDWLVPHSDSPYKAMCKACNKILLANRTELVKHKIQKKHRDCMASSGLSNMQLKSEIPEDAMMDQEEEYSIEVSLREFINVSEEGVKDGIKRMKSEHPDISFDKKKKHRPQRYRKAWESMEEFEDWIQPIANDPYVASCTFCRKIITAETSALKRHGSSLKHLKALDSRGIIFTFKKEWEKHELLKDWICRVQGNDEEAFCNACDALLNANISELKLHAKSQLHVSNVMKKEGKPSGEESGADNEEVTCDEAGGEDASADLTNFITTDQLVASAVDFTNFVDLTMKMTDLRLNLKPVEETEITQDEEDLQTSQVVYEDYTEIPHRSYKVVPTNTFSSLSSSNKKEDELPQAFVTQPAPNWKGKAVVNGHVQEMKLSDYRGRYLVMFFYPQDFSTVCSTEVIALGEVISAFRVINCEVIACSVDSHLAHLAWTKTLSSRNEARIIPLLSDSSHSISKAYGCYLASAGHALRAYYIIDKKGILRAMHINDIQVGRNLKEILRMVEAFQLVDSTDTQCPVNWTTGQPSVKVIL